VHVKEETLFVSHVQLLLLQSSLSCWVHSAQVLCVPACPDRAPLRSGSGVSVPWLLLLITGHDRSDG
jgi:hypothetical protein